MTTPRATLAATGADGTIALSGNVVLSTVDRLRAQWASAAPSGAVILDIGGIETLDTAGAWMIAELERRLVAEGRTVRLEGGSAQHMMLIERVRESLPAEHPPEPEGSGFRRRIELLGRATVEAARTATGMIGFLGLVVSVLGRVLVRPARLRGTALVYHMGEVGLNAVPIVALMAFLIGVVLAFQGATQLRQFGAEVFVVDLIAISVLRELGILLTAIIVAGRTGAAFTAAIGSMKMREEIDAMRTLGLDPIEVLVVPRVLALVIMLPILGFLADLMGLVGGALMSWIDLGVSPGLFQARLLESVDIWHFIIGIVKAPVFALIIGIVGCYEGMQVGGNAESLGRLTSTSVVTAIFLVIVADALFSIFFSVIGV